jgi:hypothetical protein
MTGHTARSLSHTGDFAGVTDGGEIDGRKPN